MQECDSVPDDVLQTTITCKPWLGASCGPAEPLPRPWSLLCALLALQSWLESSEYGKGTKAALLLAERAVQMFRILPALTSMGEAAPAPNSLISSRQREKEVGCSRARASGKLSGAEGRRNGACRAQDGTLPHTAVPGSSVGLSSLSKPSSRLIHYACFASRPTQSLLLFPLKDGRGLEHILTNRFLFPPVFPPQRRSQRCFSCPAPLEPSIMSGPIHHNQPLRF
ncbi:hypothetical protein NQZ68_008253 [Dissostichus eleginoides]|nr:hypothetical protein NQZ68_008253 [Dissostichus eleginoides]